MDRIPCDYVCRFRSGCSPQAAIAVRPERTFVGWCTEVHAEDSGRVACSCPRDALVPGRGRRKASPPTRELLVASGRLLRPEPRYGGILRGSRRAPRVCLFQSCNKLEMAERTAFSWGAALGLSPEYDAGLAWDCGSSSGGMAAVARQGLYARQISTRCHARGNRWFG